MRKSSENQRPQQQQFNFIMDFNNSSNSSTTGTSIQHVEHEEDEQFQLMNTTGMHGSGSIVAAAALPSSINTSTLNNNNNNTTTTTTNEGGVLLSGGSRSSLMSTPRTNSLSSFDEIQDEIRQRNCGMTTLWNVDDSIGSISPPQNEDFLFESSHSNSSESTSDSLEAVLNQVYNPCKSYHTIYTIILKWNNDKKKFCFDNDISYYQQPTRASLFTMIQYHQVKERIQKTCTATYRELFSTWFNKSSKFESTIKEIKSILKREELSMNSDPNSVFVAGSNSRKNENALPGNFYHSVRLSLHGVKKKSSTTSNNYFENIEFILLHA